ncbi:hypothetical protein LINGRAHAP2_LOCUS10161 [Linum grandiflorum]
MVHSKRRNRLMQQRMNDLVYVKYNCTLLENQRKKKKERVFEDIESDNEWVAEDDGETENQHVATMLVEEGDSNNETNMPTTPIFNDIPQQVSDIHLCRCFGLLFPCLLLLF